MVYDRELSKNYDTQLSRLHTGKAAQRITHLYSQVRKVIVGHHAVMHGLNAKRSRIGRWAFKV
jgi:hypothetical protein